MLYSKVFIYIPFAQYYKLHLSAIRITLRWYIIFAVFTYPHLNIMKGRAGQGGRGRGGVEVEIDISTSLIASIYPWKLLSGFFVVVVFLFFSENKSDERPFCLFTFTAFLHVYSLYFLLRCIFPEDVGTNFSHRFANFNPLNPLRLISLKSLKVSFNRYYYKSK